MKLDTRQMARRVLLVWLAGAAVRLALLRRPDPWLDEATTGLLGLAVLRGHFPVYFFGQPFMGALDGYLAAPLYAVLGVSARTLELLPVLLAVAWLGLVLRLSWETYGPRAAFLTGLVLVIPPDSLLVWSHEARNHYPLTLLLGTLALLLAVRAPTAAPSRAILHGGLLGLVLGLAFWTNFLSLVYWPSVALLSMRAGLRRGLTGAVVMLPPFVLGSLPHWVYGLPHRTAWPPAGEWIGLPALGEHLGFLLRVSWPILAGVPARETAAGALVAVFVAALYVAAGITTARTARAGMPATRAMSLALLALVVVNTATAIGTQYGRALNDDDQRYLLPLYTALPLLVGHGLAGLPARRGRLALAALALVQVAGALTGSFRGLAPSVVAAQQGELDRQAGAIAALERNAIRRLYATDVGTRILTFLSRERVIFSHHYEEPYPPYARAVDGAETAGWWFADRSPDFETNLTALGVRFAYRPMGAAGGAYTDFVLAAPPLYEVDPARLTVTAHENETDAGSVVDRDAVTLWRSPGPMRGGEWIRVDLGDTRPVALVRWLPGRHEETPRGLTLEASVDGQTWRRLVEVPTYLGPLYWSAGRPMARVRSGRVELRVAPTPARYLKITQTGRSPLWEWAIRELFVYAASEGPPASLPHVDGAALAAALRQAGVARLYADHGWGSRVALVDPGIRVLPANVFLDPYGDQGPPQAFLPELRWAPGTGVLLEPVEAEGFAAVARASGLSFVRQPVEGLVLFTYAPRSPPRGAPLAAAAFRVSASVEPDRARLAADGDPRTRWATGRPQAAGDWVRIDLATPRVVRAVRLETAHPTDAPRGVRLEGSEDGGTWRPLPAEVSTKGRLIWGGVAILRMGVHATRLDFAPVALRALRLVLTRGDSVFDWSIHELAVYGAD